jgi:hypothetical protein
MGRVVARFNASHYTFRAEEVELSKVDKRINKVRKVLEESKDLLDKS